MRWIKYSCIRDEGDEHNGQFRVAIIIIVPWSVTPMRFSIVTLNLARANTLLKAEMMKALVYDRHNDPEALAFLNKLFERLT